MPGSLSDRFRCLTQSFSMPAATKPPLLERLWRPFEWYGSARKRINRELKLVERRDGAVLYAWHEYRVWWPTEADPARLVSMFVELFVASNPHYFTPAWLPAWRTDAVVIDVGSCEGLFALRAACEFKASVVVAIEPGKKMAELLGSTFSANSCGAQMKVIQCLAGRQAGQARFSECLADPTQARIMPATEAGQGEVVEIKTLDALSQELHLPRVDVIKIDAEGADFDILQGAEDLIRHWRPMLLVTTYHLEEHASLMREWVDKLGLGYRFVFRGVVTMGSNQARPVLMLAYCE